jgi:hypothetical protein
MMQLYNTKQKYAPRYVQQMAHEDANKQTSSLHGTACNACELTCCLQTQDILVDFRAALSDEHEERIISYD